MYNGNNISSTITSTLTGVTLPTITSVSFGTVTSSSIYITSVIGYYYYINVYRIYNSVSTYVGTINYPDNSYNDTGLYSNASYSYQLYLYNTNNVVGNPYSIGPKYTLGSIKSATYGKITTYYIYLKNITEYYNKVKLTWIYTCTIIVLVNLK